MQTKSLKLKAKRQDGIPIIDHFLNRLGLEDVLAEHIGHRRHVQAILLLIKNILIDHRALYAIGEWSRPYDPELVYNGSFSDDVIAQALNKVFSADRATIQTEVIIRAIEEL